jgi:uncharacterized protein YndB with AHSA1/START domain
MSEFVVEKSVVLNASPLMVWRALTNPEVTKKYFFHCKVYSDWKAGSPITFRGRALLIKNIELKGVIVKAEPGKLLKYILQNADGESQSVVTDRLTYENGQTILSVSDDVGAGEGAEKRYQRSVRGWDKVLKGLKEVMEQN